MNIKYYISILSLLIVFASFSTKSPKEEKLKPISKFKLKTPEPSGIIHVPNSSNYIISSDKGYLYEIDSVGKTIRKADFEGVDFEGVTFINDSIIAVVSERDRRVHFVQYKDFKKVRTIEVPYHGGRNLSYEAIAYLGDMKLLLITEKSPIYFREVNISETHGPVVVNEMNRSSLSSDISDAFFDSKYLWLVSDEDSRVMVTDIKGETIIKSWKIPVLNPEGICMNNKGQMVIVSDNEHVMYVFERPKF